LAGGGAWEALKRYFPFLGNLVLCIFRGDKPNDRTIRPHDFDRSIRSGLARATDSGFGQDGAAAAHRFASSKRKHRHDMGHPRTTKPAAVAPLTARLISA